MAHEKKLLVDVFQAYFYRKDASGNRNLVFMSENLTSGGIVSSQENTDVRNGQGNGLFAILPGQKDVTVNLTENVFSFEALELNSAAKRSAGAATGNTGLIVKGAGTVTPDAGTGGTFTTLKMLEIEGKKFPVNAKEVSIQIGEEVLENVTKDGTPAGTDVSAGKFMIVKDKSGAAYTGDDSAFIVLNKTDADKLATQALKIMPYVYKIKDQNTKILTIDAKTFAEGGELWLQTIEKDAQQKATAYVYFVFENAMPEGNFEINTVSEVQPNDMTVNMRVLPDQDGNLYKIIREEIKG